MGLLKYLFILFLLAFPLAEVGRVQLSNGVAVSINDILLGVVIAVWLGSHFLKKRKFVFGELFKPILIFASIGLISLLFNFTNLGVNNLLASSLYLVRWIAYALIYVVVNEFDNKFKNKISYLLLISGTTVVLLGYFQLFFYPSLRNLYYLGWDEHLYRMFSTFLDPNFAGAFFVLFFAFTVSLVQGFLKKKSWPQLVTVSLVAVLTTGALYLTYSRSALLMFAVTVVSFLVLYKQKKLIAFALVLIVLLIFILPKSFTTEGTNFLREVSSNARIKTAQEALTVIQKSPLYGVGFNAYRYAGNRLGVVTGSNWQASHGGAGTDNSFLFVLATTGIIGLIAYVYLVCKMIALGLKNKYKSKYAIIFVSLFLGLIINSLFINSLFYVFILEWIWILASLTERS
jgi:O-antigen ligase